MVTGSDPRPGIGRLIGPITSLIGGVLLVVGFLAEQSSSGDVAGGSGLPFYIFGGLAIFVGVCWSVVVSVIELVELARRTDDRQRAATSLAANLAAPLGLALLILVVWLTNAS